MNRSNFPRRLAEKRTKALEQVLRRITANSNNPKALEQAKYEEKILRERISSSAGCRSSRRNAIHRG